MTKLFPRLFQESLSPDTDLHLLPITGERIEKVFGEPVQIPAGTYAWQSEAVDTVGVLAGVMPRNFAPDSEECKQVMRVSRMIQADFRPKLWILYIQRRKGLF